MIYSESEIQTIRDNFPAILKELNGYGHMEEREFVVIKNGSIYEFNIYGDEILQIYGDKLSGTREVLSKLLGKPVRSYPWTNDLHDTQFVNIIETLEGNINSKYAPDYINIMSTILKYLNQNKDFVVSFNTKYKDTMKRNIIKYFNYNNNDYIAIPLLYLLKNVMKYDLCPEYVEIIKRHTECPENSNISKYVREIAKDIYTEFQ
jgi:hypothetical protein